MMQTMLTLFRAVFSPRESTPGYLTVLRNTATGVAVQTYLPSNVPLPSGFVPA